jgi:hypothetical protein
MPHTNCIATVTSGESYIYMHHVPSHNHLLHNSQTKKTKRSSADNGEPDGQSDLHELEVPAANHECNAVTASTRRPHIHSRLPLLESKLENKLVVSLSCRLGIATDTKVSIKKKHLCPRCRNTSTTDAQPRCKRRHDLEALVTHADTGWRCCRQASRTTEPRRAFYPRIVSTLQLYWSCTCILKYMLRITVDRRYPKISGKGDGGHI